MDYAPARGELTPENALRTIAVLIPDDSIVEDESIMADISWVKLPEGMGVEAAAAETCEEFARLMQHPISKPGAFLIEARIGRR